MIDLEPWQWVFAAISLLGLSPAPWLAAMLAGRLITRSTHEGRVKDLKDELDRGERRHNGTVERLVAERDYERQAKDLERERANALADKLAEATNELGATAVHLLESLQGIGGNGQ